MSVFVQFLHLELFNLIQPDIVSFDCKLVFNYFKSRNITKCTNDYIVKRSVLSYGAGLFLDRLKQQPLSKLFSKNSRFC